MLESTYWLALEHRLCDELREMPELALRRYWCDGFAPEHYRLDLSPPRIDGSVWLGVGVGDRECWRFSLILAEGTRTREQIDWKRLLPPTSALDWLAVDEVGRAITVRG